MLRPQRQERRKKCLSRPPQPLAQARVCNSAGRSSRPSYTGGGAAEARPLTYLMAPVGSQAARSPPRLVQVHGSNVIRPMRGSTGPQRQQGTHHSFLRRCLARTAALPALTVHPIWAPAWCGRFHRHTAVPSARRAGYMRLRTSAWNQPATRPYLLHHAHSLFLNSTSTTPASCRTPHRTDTLPLHFNSHRCMSWRQGSTSMVYRTLAIGTRRRYQVILRDQSQQTAMAAAAAA